MPRTTDFDESQGAMEAILWSGTFEASTVLDIVVKFRSITSGASNDFDGLDLASHQASSSFIICCHCVCLSLRLAGSWKYIGNDELGRIHILDWIPA